MYLGEAKTTLTEDIKSATEATAAAAELAKTASPLVQMALSTFMTMVSASPAMLEPALNMLPSDLRAKIKASMPRAPKKDPRPKGPPPPPTQKQEIYNPPPAQTEKGLPWGYIAAGAGVLGLAGFLLTRKRRK